MEQRANGAPKLTLSRALLDTTVQVDRVKCGSRKETLDRLISAFGFKFVASLSVVEFKATFIQECITIHNQLRINGARFTRVRDSLLEKNHPQKGLRSHIFNNFINVFAPSSFDVTLEQDQQLAEEARLLLENQIPEVFRWFSSHESVDSVLRDKLRCDRALEPPVKKTAAFGTNLPVCRRGVNKTCRVETLIRDDSPKLVNGLGTAILESSQLSRAATVFDSVHLDPNRELSVEDCRRAGDCLIALEALGSVTHALSSNAREWAPISKAAGFEFVHTEFPEEKTR